jgi:hypothetical protein
MEHHFTITISQFNSAVNVFQIRCDDDFTDMTVFFPVGTSKLDYAINIEKLKKPEGLQPSERILKLIFRKVLTEEIDRDKL